MGGEVDRIKFFQEMHIHYTLACTHGQSWSVLKTPWTKWGDIRYELESRLLRAGRRRHLWSYFAAVRASDFVRPYNPDKGLREADTMRPGDQVVLFRKPYPAALLRIDEVEDGVYVPQTQRLRDMSEDERIKYMIQHSMETVSVTRHPAEYTYVNGVPVPDKEYTCRGCGTKGEHFRTDCHLGRAEQGMALDRVQRAYGIPKALLRRVDQTHQHAMKDADGNYVVRA